MDVPKRLNTGETELVITALQQCTMGTHHSVSTAPPLSQVSGVKDLSVSLDRVLSFDQRGESPDGLLHLRSVAEISPVLSTVGSHPHIYYRLD